MENTEEIIILKKYYTDKLLTNRNYSNTSVSKFLCIYEVKEIVIKKISLALVGQ